MKHPLLHIVALFNKGDAQALAHVFELHNRSLCYFAERLTGDRQEAEDIVADVFMKLWKKRTDFANLQNIKAFLYIATRNACFDFLKHRKRSNSSHEEILYLSEENDDALLRTMIETELLQKVYGEIERLPKKCRTIFKMIHFDGLSTEEVAGKLNISRQNVLNQKARAIQLLRIFVLQKKFLLFVTAFLGLRD
jgi:RNA polymerase sigma-70 factor (ECF subfamily)